MDLRDKKVVIIGGSSGIGEATARAAVQAGALVLIASRSEEKLRRAKEAIGGRIGTQSVDLREAAQVRRLFERVGGFDHLIITAAEGVTGRFLELPEESVQALFASKFWGQYRAARQAVPRLNQGGSITFFSGVAAQRPIRGFSSFAAVNGAINGLCRALALELAPVRVNAVSPGIVDTPAYAGMPLQERQGFFAAVGSKLPVGRVGRPEEVAEAVLYLLRSDFVTGTVLEIDGGGRLS